MGALVLYDVDHDDDGDEQVSVSTTARAPANLLPDDNYSMKPYASLLARLGPRCIRARTFSTSTSLRRNDPFAFATEAKSYVASFYKATRNPVWLLVDTLQTSPGELYVDAALAESCIPSRDFEKWRVVVTSPDIDTAVAHLNGNLEVPDWVLSCLVIFKVKTAAQAEGPLLDLVFANRAAPDIQGPVLIITAFHLARHNLLVHIPRVVDTFLTIPLKSPARAFNRLLTALASVPLRSPQIANIITSVLEAMDTRQIEVFPHTYTKILNDRFVTIQLAKFVLLKIQRETVRVEPAHFENLLRIFTKYGATDEAKMCYNALHAAARSLTPNDESNEEALQRVYRANTTMLGTSSGRHSAMSFMDQLEKSSAPKLPETNIYDQTTALHVLAQDLSVSAKTLITRFVKIVGMPTIATYTVLVRGLLLRKEYGLAEAFWIKIVKAGWPMDRHSLTAGIQALARNGSLHGAFKVLEKFSLKPGEEAEQHPDDDNITGQATKVRITTVTMNEVMVLFNRVGRPDVVFRMWDYMGTLYDVRPDALSLSILLQAARMAMSKDDSLSGFLAKLRTLNPLARRPASQPDSGSYDSIPAQTSADARAAAVAAIEAIVGVNTSATYRSSIWRDMEPFELARTIFLQAFFGNHADRLDELLALPAPARAWRMSSESEAYQGDGLGLPQWRVPLAYAFEPPPEGLLAPGRGEAGGAGGPRRSLYPTVVVTNANCFNYIALLGVGGRVPEIPYVLAWMRAVGVVPSTSTLALAMVFFREVTVQAPLVEKWRGRQSDGEKDEYEKLVDWIVDWVGQARLPREDKMNKWQFVANQMRMPKR